MTNTPETKFKAGQMTATVWKNDRKEGQEYDTFSVNIEKSYKDKDGSWKKTTNYQLNDLPKVVLVTQKAFEYLALNKTEDKGATPSSLSNLNNAPSEARLNSIAQVNTKGVKMNPSECISPTTDKQKAYNTFVHLKASLEEKKVLGIVDELEYTNQLNSAIKDYSSLF
jgi:hypothetical protein